MKRISSVLWLAVAAFCCYGQNKVSPKHSAQTAEDNRKPKIINPEGKTPWPYMHAVFAGLQDGNGSLWFATSEGIYRYDGKLFTKYTTMAGLSTLSVRQIIEDRVGNLWFPVAGNAILYNGKTFSSISIPKAGPGERSAIDIWADIKSDDASPVVNVFPDKEGNIWFYKNLDIYRYDQRSQSAVLTGLGRYLRTEVMPDDNIRRDATVQNVYEDKKGDLWFTIAGCSTPLHETYRLNGSRVNQPCLSGTCKHDLHNATDRAAHNRQISAVLTRITTNDGKTSIAYISVLDDDNGGMWFGTYDSGVYRYDGKFVTRFSDKESLGTSAVGFIYKDRTGSIWFGTGDRNLDEGNGVFRYDPSSGKGAEAITHFTTKDGLCNTGSFRNNFITSIIEDNAGKLWFGGYGGVSCYNGKTFTSFTKMDGFNEQPVNCIVKDRAGNVWIGTWELGLYRCDGRKSMTCFTESKSTL